MRLIHTIADQTSSGWLSPGDHGEANDSRDVGTDHQDSTGVRRHVLVCDNGGHNEADDDHA